MSTFYAILAPVFGDELHPAVHPDLDNLPNLYAIYTKVGGSVFGDLEGDSDLRRARIQLSIYGTDYDEVELKEKAVIAAMNDANTVANDAVTDKLDPFTVESSLPNRIVGESVDGYEKDTKRFMKRLEYYCWRKVSFAGI